MLNVKVIHCVSCGRFYTPPVYFCRFCRSERLEEAEIPGRGILYTYSTVYVPLSTLEKEAPYTVAIIELKGGCRVTGRLVNPSPEKLAIGVPIEITEVRDGIYFFDFTEGGD